VTIWRIGRQQSVRDASAAKCNTFTNAPKSLRKCKVSLRLGDFSRRHGVTGIARPGALLRPVYLSFAHLFALRLWCVIKCLT